MSDGFKVFLICVAFVGVMAILTEVERHILGSPICYYDDYDSCRAEEASLNF